VVPVEGQIPALFQTPTPSDVGRQRKEAPGLASSAADQAELDLMIFEELDFSALDATPVGPKNPPPLRRSPDPPKVVPEKASLEVVWYVRLPSGGQFGPATSDVIQAWIAEGRVSSDSLVWREGWRDWQLLSEAFPDRSEESPNSLQAIVSRQPPLLAKAGAAGRRPPKRASENYRTLAVILLVVIAVILSGVLIWVLIKGSGSAPAPDVSNPPVSSIACQAWLLGRLPPMHPEQTR
jgi:hypothetical protein